MASPRRALRRIKRRLSIADVEVFAAAISAAIARRAPDHGVVSWSFAGTPPLLQVEARTRRVHHVPRAFTVWLPAPLRGRLRVTVTSGLARAREPTAFLGAERMDEPLAPGAPIAVGDGSGARSAGIAAVVAIGGTPYLLTCGHVFADGDPNVFTYDDPDPIAILSVTYLEAASPIDAAICALTDHGRDLLAASDGAATWFRRCIAPSPAMNGQRVTFWPTSDGPTGPREPIETTVTSYSASSNILFGGAPRDGFVELPFGVSPGDSGSVLATLDDEVVGLCSGQLEERWSLFTPLATVLDRLAADYGNVTLWNPERLDATSRA